ncbi:hypothetical protein MKW92_043410 [Papaver armeniacum]|nr:hypothetical protein MKW92_043410 [Papaver armeniacum]
MGLDIEDHLKKKVRELEKEKILLYDAMKSQILELRHFHTQNRFEVTSFLEQEKNQFKSILDAVQERIQFQASLMKSSEHEQTVAKLDDLECRDVHITTDTGLVPQSPPALPKALGDEVGDTSDALAQALQEKVSALLLLSQQDERQLLERNVNAALQEKMDELQKNLLQVTNEKVKALMELAQLRQEYQVLQEDIIHERKQGHHSADSGEKNITTQEREVGKLANLLKKTYLSRWVGRQDPNETGGQMNNKSNNSVDYARSVDSVGLLCIFFFTFQLHCTIGHSSLHGSILD